MPCHRVYLVLYVCGGYSNILTRVQESLQFEIHGDSSSDQPTKRPSASRHCTPVSPFLTVLPRGNMMPMSLQHLGFYKRFDRLHIFPLGAMPKRNPRVRQGKWFWVPDGVNVNIGQVPLDDLDEHVEVYVEESDHESQKQNSPTYKVQKRHITKEPKKKEKADGKRTAAIQKSISSAGKGQSKGSEDRRPRTAGHHDQSLTEHKQKGSKDFSSWNDGYGPAIDQPYDFWKEKGTCSDPGEGNWKKSQGGDHSWDNKDQMETGEGHHGDAWSDYMTEWTTSYDQTVQAPWHWPQDGWWENYEGQTWTATNNQMETQTGHQVNEWLHYMSESTAYDQSVPWFWCGGDQWWDNSEAQTAFAKNRELTGEGLLKSMTQSKTSVDQTVQASGPLAEKTGKRNMLDIETGEHFVFYIEDPMGSNMTSGNFDCGNGQLSNTVPKPKQPQVVPAPVRTRGRSVMPPRPYATSAKSKAQPSTSLV